MPIKGLNKPFNKFKFLVNIPLNMPPAKMGIIFYIVSMQPVNQSSHQEVGLKIFEGNTKKIFIDSHGISFASKMIEKIKTGG